MSSRQEEKEKRKQERLAREAAAAAAAKRARMLQMVGGAIVAIAAVAGVAFAISAGGGGGSDIDDGELRVAARAGGCVYRAFPEEGRDHEAKTFTAADYKTNPPTSGNHVPTGSEAPDGIYVAGNEPGIGNWVHTLEHGRVELQYRPGVDMSVVNALERLFNENVKGSSGYHSLLMRNNTKMPFQVAAVAWRHYMACKTYTPKSIEALRAFREALVDKAPELVP